MGLTSLGDGMTAVATRSDYDVTDLPWVVRAGIKLGVLESVLVLLYSLVDRFLSGPVEFILCLIILVVGLAAVTVLPGVWTRPRTIEGIAGAAGIGLMAAVVYLLIDVAILQPIGTYTNRWLEIGGGANWWYHPVWWMVGTFIPWFGAWILANQSVRSGSDRPSVGGALGLVFGLTVLVMVAAVLLHFPGAAWGLGTFGVSFLPGLALALLVSLLGTRRA
jgi:hypothetical protein